MLLFHEGSAVMVIVEECESVEEKSVIYIPCNQEHYLENNNHETLEMIFVYSPANIVDHWERERTGVISQK